MAASKPAGSPPPMAAYWATILRGDGFAASAPRLTRRLFALVPGRPRCKFCNAPYGGPLTMPFRVLGYRPSNKTPHVCARCLEWAPEGGLDQRTWPLPSSVSSIFCFFSSSLKWRSRFMTLAKPSAQS